jgi:hypothetical protein
MFFPGVSALAVLLLFVFAVAAVGQQIAGQGADEPTESLLPHSGGGAADSFSPYVVQQRVGGNIFGRVRMFDASGKLKPVRAGINFVQAGKVVASARGDEWGHFQAVGLQPGIYSVLAVSRQGFSTLSIIVRPPEVSAAAEKPKAFEVSFSMQAPPPLDITLIPVAEFDLLAELLAQMFADSEAGQLTPSAAGSGGGGGGGGGGGDGLGSLLGAAGLSGLAGRAGTRTQASPSSP